MQDQFQHEFAAEERQDQQHYEVSAYDQTGKLHGGQSRPAIVTEL